MAYCRNIIIFLNVLLIYLLIVTDICASVISSIKKTGCINSYLCIDSWLLSYGMGSLSFNYLRLIDLISLIDAYGEEISISEKNFICRISFNVILILFHLIEGIIGIIIFINQIIPDYGNPNIHYEYEIISIFVMMTIIANFCWMLYAISFIYFKCTIYYINDE